MSEEDKEGQKKSLAETIAGLSDRERKLLAAMFATFAVLGIFVTVMLVQRSLDTIEAETTTYEDVLNLLATAGPDYLAQEAGGAVDPRVERFSEEVLDNNTVQLTSLVATHATAANIAVSSYDEDQSPIGSARGNDGGPIIVERLLRVDIRRAEMNALVDLLDRIEKSDDPVIIKRVDVRSVGGEGQVRAQLVVSTYQRRAQEES
ncbi:hypothetical protein EA187_10150 [Lujinxingia sediminis]|uniref:Type II secretion system protein M n=1 Tax=Lujinxingia sediminis TaxID=2480984 RepID=A0ABY0CUR6_9DELT|nr:hypothetical protein [Lujinxingia sediminis]RVU44889.1 hypothetical protein EA187_10150 [Lujinxingia sediminis]